jgi:hypothetical protein
MRGHRKKVENYQALVDEIADLQAELLAIDRL